MKSTHKAESLRNEPGPLGEENPKLSLQLDFQLEESMSSPLV